MPTTWNPADLVAINLSALNLHATPTGQGGVRSIYGATAGKYYFELAFGTSGFVNSTALGIANASANNATVVTNGIGSAYILGAGTTGVNGTAQASIGAFSLNDVGCVALDMDGKLVWFRHGAAGNWNGSGTANPATGVGGYSITGLTGGAATMYAWGGSTASNAANFTANFGDSAFAGAVPSGFISGFPATNALATQVAAEHWLTTSPPAQVTQVALEHWATVTGTGLQAVVTQVALEHWASVAVVPAFVNGPIITMIN